MHQILSGRVCVCVFRQGVEFGSIAKAHDAQKSRNQTSDNLSYGQQ